MSRLTIKLQLSERDALIKLAASEKRRPHDQAALIIYRELERLGLLPTDKETKAESQQERNPN